jgi:hypothetical protein
LVGVIGMNFYGSRTVSSEVRDGTVGLTQRQQPAQVVDSELNWDLRDS